MSTSPLRGRALLCLCLTIVLTFCSCSEDDENDIIVNASLRGPNETPSIVATGPEFPGGAIEAVGGYPTPFYAVVADGNGLEDISAVFLEIGTIQLNGIICRPDESTSPPNYCDHRPDYTDTLDVSSVCPSTFPGLKNIRMYNTAGGIYTAPYLYPAGCEYGECPVLVDLEGASPTFTRSLLTCSDYYDGFFQFRVIPPTVPAELEVYITQVDITLIGIKVTVYDAAGKSATATIPDLRITYMTRNEEEAAP